MGSWWLALWSAGATAVVSATALDAHAQPPRQAPPGPLVIHRDPAEGAVGVGRARMSKGDYAGALEAFDAALRTSADPVLHRDRGLCHEQLGHPFPAMDDFRYYLTALPDAPDSEDVRNRLNQLETANGLGGTGTGAAQSPGAARVSSHEDPFAVDAKNPKDTEGVAGSGDQARAGNYDQEIAANERWDEAEASPLRRGTGLSFGVYGRGFAGSTGGIAGYGTGATIRGALGPVSTLYGEIGYVSYQVGDPLTGIRDGGVSVGFGYEARIRLDQLASNALILSIVVNYEHVTDANAAITMNPSPTDYLDPRVKFGYRHVFGPGFGVEIAAEVAQPLDFENISSQLTTFGGTGALLVGF